MQQLVIGIGEALWDVLPSGRRLGGAPANFAYHVAQFGFRSAAVSAVGNDDLGTEALAAFEAVGLRCIMPRVGYPTGRVDVSLDDKGVPSYNIREGAAWDNIPFTPDVEAAAGECRAVCWGTLAQRSQTSRATIGRFLDAVPHSCLKIFDINLRGKYFTKEIIEDSLRRCNVLKINDEELADASSLLGFPEGDAEQTCRRLMSVYALDALVLTCGVNGSYVFTPAATSFRPTPRVAVADTVGAGDSFTAAMCAAMLSGLPMTDAHELAAQTSAFVCTQSGAMPKLPENISRTIHGSS